MYPSIDAPPNFDSPDDRLFMLQGILSAQKIHEGKNRDQDAPAIFVIKHGLTTYTTIGRLSGFKSGVRRYFTPGSENSTELAVYPYSSRRSPFSDGGDSGSIVIDTSGKFVGLLTTGAGPTRSTDITYASPMYWLWDIIKGRFPGANLYFDNI